MCFKSFAMVFSGVPNTIAHWQCDSYNAYNRKQEQGSKWSDDDTSIPSVAATWTPPRSPQYGVPIPTGTNPVCSSSSSSGSTSTSTSSSSSSCVDSVGSAVGCVADTGAAVAGAAGSAVSGGVGAVSGAFGGRRLGSTCGCNCPTGTSGEWCECLDCPQESELQWAVSKFVSCETGPTCDCTSGNGLSCKAVETQRGWKPAHREGLCGKASCSDDKEKSRRLAAATTPSASENAITNATEYGGCCSSPELLSKAVLSPTPFCRANPEQFTVVQVCLLRLLRLLRLLCWLFFNVILFFN